MLRVFLQKMFEKVIDKHISSNTQKYIWIKISYSVKYLVNAKYFLFTKVIVVSCDRTGRCPKLKNRVVLFWTHFIHISFIKLCFNTKEKIPNGMPFTSCQNSKYFRFYGTFIYSRNFEHLFLTSILFKRLIYIFLNTTM